MNKNQKITSFLLGLICCLTTFVSAGELIQTLEEDLPFSYKESVERLNEYMSTHWNKKPTYFNDGITYAVEISDQTAIFKVRRYNTDIQHIDPFLIIKLERKPESHCHLTTWEGEVGNEFQLDLTHKVKSLFKKCKKGCPLT